MNDVRVSSWIELQEAVGSIRHLEELGEFALFVEPPSVDARIVNQYALFSVMAPVDLHIEDWAARIVIPAELKWEVRDKLDQANVTERVLFPGLDGISRWLARYYAPRA